MTRRFPSEGRWIQTNSSDKIGSLAYSRCVNLDSEGYIRLSPRTVCLMDDTADSGDESDTNFGIPVAFGRTTVGEFYVATSNSQFDLDVDNSTKTIAEDTTGSNPSLTQRSHGVWWQNRWHVSLSTSVSYLSGTWTANAITGLSSSYRHAMAVFKSRNTLVVTNGNVLKQYDTAYSNTIDLTIPSDYEMTGVAYNAGLVGIITRLGSDTAGQNQSAMFYAWDGATTGSTGPSVEIGADFALAIVAYRSSFVILTNEGQLLYWNGGGFDELAALPFYYEDYKLGDLVNHLTLGSPITVEGDRIFINVPIGLSPSGRLGSSPRVNSPAGVWCFDPRVGLYHRYAASNTKAYLHSISDANINISTNIFTTTNTIPATGNPIRMTDSAGVGGIYEGETYYLIKLSATTFSIAASKDLAEAGTAIDITSAGSGTSYFWAYDVVDYGILYSEQGRRTGSIAIWGNDETNYLASKDVLFGGEYLDTDLTERANLVSAVPLLESRGSFVVAKTYSRGVTDLQRKVFVKFKPLRGDDAIIVKFKTREISDLPVTVPQHVSQVPIGEAVWSSQNTFTSVANLAAAKTWADVPGNHVEIEFLAGAGAGQAVRLLSITESGGTYTVMTEDLIVGAGSGSKSYFSMDNWKQVAYITSSSTENKFGYLEAAIGENATKVLIKVEMRGCDVAIEDVDLVGETSRGSQ